MYNLLVVSSDTAFIRQCQQLADYEVIHATDLDGIKAAVSKFYDHLICVLDLEQTVLGFEQVKSYKYPTLIAGRIEQQVQISDYLKQGAFDYLVKPITSELLLKRLKNADALNTYENLTRITTFDLRSPLSVIQGYTSLLLEDYELFDEQQLQDAIGAVAESTQTALKVIALIKDLDEVSSDHLQLVKTRLDPYTLLINNTREFQKANLRWKNRALRLEIAEALPNIEADEWRLRQALRIMFETLPRRGESLITASQQGESLVIRLSPLSDHHNIYSYRRMIKDGYSRLYISGQIFRLHGGSIQFSETPENGISATLILPIAES